jgi:Spy/CpxP family protein refolding chaperone
MGRMWRDFGSGRMMDRMGRGMKPLPGEGNEIWRNVPGIRMFENLPGLTDKQKKDIGELRQKQQDEMMKFRDEMLSKMKALRESHLGKIMDLLTPEQKKWVEENSKNPPEK